MSLGIIGGFIVYKQYAREQLNRFRFHGFCQFPYERESMDNSVMFLNSRFRDGSTSNEVVSPQEDYMKPIADAFKAIERQWLNQIQEEVDDSNSNSNSNENGYQSDSFSEEFDLDEDVAKITVPTFREGRAGRFVHDFKLNQSCIIDLNANRCFVMPLDRSQVVPPRNMRDLIVKVSCLY